MSAVSGTKDRQTGLPDGGRAQPPAIEGVIVRELGNILTRSGYMSEIFRTDWEGLDIGVRQVNWMQLNPDGVTDWHVHHRQTDHLIAVGGGIKLALFDDRPMSPTKGASEIIRFGALRPLLVVVPSGVWHGLRNESGAPAGYINVIDRGYDHADPDNRRAAPHAVAFPDIL